MRPALGRRHRRPVRPGDPPGRGALRLAGARGAARRSRSSAWAASDRPGRARVHPRRRERGRRSAPRSSTTRRAPVRVLRELRRRARRARLRRGSRDAVGYGPPASPTPATSTRDGATLNPMTLHDRAHRRRARRAGPRDRRSLGGRGARRTCSTLKVGLELFLRARPRRGRRGAAAASGGRDVFLDLKLHDIPTTVAGAARSVARLEPTYLTVHASGGSGHDAGRRRGAAGHEDRRRDRPHVLSAERPRPAIGVRRPAARRRTPARGRSRSRPARGRSCARRRRSPRSARRSARTSR